MVRPQPTAFPHIQRPFQQRPKNCRLHQTPILIRRPAQRLKLPLRQLKRRTITKKPTIKPQNPFKPKPPTRIHRLPQPLNLPLKLPRIRNPTLPQRSRKHLPRQQPHILRKHRKNAPHQKIRHRICRSAHSSRTVSFAVSLLAAQEA